MKICRRSLTHQRSSWALTSQFVSRENRRNHLWLKYRTWSFTSTCCRTTICQLNRKTVIGIEITNRQEKARVLWRRSTRDNTGNKESKKTKNSRYSSHTYRWISIGTFMNLELCTVLSKTGKRSTLNMKTFHYSLTIQSPKGRMWYKVLTSRSMGMSGNLKSTPRAIHKSMVSTCLYFLNLSM